MKTQEAYQYPVRVLCVLVFTADFVLSDAASLRKHKFEVLTSENYIQLINTRIPALGEFTLCLDLYRMTNTNPWTAFTYHIVNDKHGQKQELGLVGVGKKLELYHFGSVIAVDKELPISVWHFVCSTWDSSNGRLELYVNGSKIFNTTTHVSQYLKANGSLILGINHTKKGEEIKPLDNHNFVGFIYNVQIWDFKRHPDKLGDCSEGNVVRWRNQFWKSRKGDPVVDDHLRCAFTVDIPSTATTHKTSVAFTLPETTSGSRSEATTTKRTPGTVLASTSSTMPPVDPLTSSQTSATVTTYISTSPAITSSGMYSSTVPQHEATNASQTSSSSVATTKVSQTLVTTHSGLSTPTTTKSNDETTLSKPAMPSAEVTFYSVQMNITVLETRGNIDVELASNITENMLDDTFKTTDFAVLQFTVYDEMSNESWEGHREKGQMKRKETDEDNGNFNYGSKVIVRAVSSDTAQSLTEKLQDLLEGQDYTDAQSNKKLSVKSVKVQLLDPGSCPLDVTNSGEQGLYQWEEKNPTETAIVPCKKTPNEFATRYCNINITNYLAEWKKPNLERCISFPYLPDTINALTDVIVTPENAIHLAEHILNLTKQLEFLSKEETEIILSKVPEIVELGEIDLRSAKTTLDIVNAILMKGGHLRPFTNRILGITEELGYKMTFSGEMANITAQTLVISVSKVNFSEFEEVFFTVMSYLEGKDPEISMQKFPVGKAVAFVRLPGAIRGHAVTATSKVQFNFFGKTALFKDEGSSNSQLNTYVVSASVANTKIRDLSDPVVLTLRHILPNKDKNPVHCVFWDFHQNNGIGGWNTSGCKVKFNNIKYTTCHCYHLTHFGVLLDLSRKPLDPLNEFIMSILTYVGCGTASVFLGISLVTYLAFKPLRKDYPSKILMNLSSALLMLNLVFLINNWLSSFQSYGLCISCAALLHYFLLASFTWMGLEAVHMYFALVKVFNVYIRNYILKFCIAGWGIPAIVVAIVLIINRDFYGSESNFKQYTLSNDNPDNFCWIQNDVVFYLSVVGYFCVIFLMNISMFIVVILQINSIKSKRMKNWKLLFLHDLKGTISLAFLLGLTWGFAFFAWDPVRVTFLYLFAIFNTLQGFFIFLFHCLMKENVRKQWRMHLCCGRFRLDNCSDWSRLSNLEAKQKSQVHKLPSQSFHSARSNTTESTSNSSSTSGSSRNGPPDRNSGNGGIFMRSASVVPPKQAAKHPDTRRILTFVE
ncbi:adhesion G-protein coupled receptor G4 isoform X2 [Ascaphus truei]